ncbi:MAG: hypothetical protein HYR85_08205 [Planctomycetes bacterium]|nr:hypothetical protein [Planctomycetota bacterium]
MAGVDVVASTATLGVVLPSIVAVVRTRGAPHSSSPLFILHSTLRI